MQELHLFEYAIIRVVPRVEREEFFNVGVILYCKSQGFLMANFHLDNAKFSSFNSELEVVEVEDNLNAFISICNGKNIKSPIASLDLPSRFRWLTATRSTVIQCSRVHPGFCTDAKKKLDKIFEKMVF